MCSLNLFAPQPTSKTVFGFTFSFMYFTLLPVQLLYIEKFLNTGLEKSEKCLFKLLISVLFIYYLIMFTSVSVLSYDVHSFICKMFINAHFNRLFSSTNSFILLYKVYFSFVSCAISRR